MCYVFILYNMAAALVSTYCSASVFYYTLNAATWDEPPCLGFSPAVNYFICQAGGEISVIL